MKNSILITLVLFVNISFSQEKNNLLNQYFFKTNIEENHYLAGNIFSDSQFFIKNIEYIKPINNSEGKFPIYNIDDKSIATTKNEKPSTLVAENHSKLIDDIIVKKLNTGDLELITQNEAKNYGDKGVLLKRNFPRDLDKLQSTYKITPKIQFQIGKNLNNYLKKSHKDKIDETLQNSLNLLAFIF